ncbi:cytochrome-c oxidase, cbb3-type subunit III [Piscinibacter sakaiensis]|uniref:cytochrome-c oxidase, cbb3-type subunit III n=1 Tax=Piscinibacter sakaiensis TaxID=1547922 RepID=UPI003AAF0BC7
MSDFTSPGWSIAVAALTIIGLIACLWLLLVASRRRKMADDNSTGHVWDEDLIELNNPLPRWWVGLFILTVLFAIAYLTFYPGLGSASGTLNWSSAGQYEAEQARANEKMQPLYARFVAMDAEALSKDTQAMGIGERLFINNCSTCHGSDARGSRGFPNLADGDWLYGGSLENIVQSITLGRQGMMPPMAAAVGNAEDVRHLANHVLSLSGSPHDSLSAQIGRSKYAACAACHGSQGEGNQALGAPRLNDRIWLHGWGEDAIVRIVNQGKTNVMPAQSGRLTAEQIHVLAGYVWSLSRRGTVVASQ